MCVWQRGFGKEFEGGMRWDGDGSVLGQLGSGYTNLVTKNLFQDFGVELVGQIGKFLFPVF